MTKLRELRRKSVGAVLDGVEANGFAGLVTTVHRMIGENQPSIDCLRQADVDFASAADAEQVWDAALDMADCLRDALLEPDLLKPPEPPPEPPEPQPDRTLSLADVVLAALLVRLRDKGTTGRPIHQHRQESERV